MMANSVLPLLFCMLLALSVQAADYKYNPRRTAPGGDIDCGQKDSNGKPQSFCKICDGVTAVADACDSNPKCQGFDMEGSYCGYLKAHAGRGKTVYTEAFSHFCKIGGTGSCEGDFIAKRRSDVAGNDINCNAKDYQGKALSYCEIQSNLIDVAAACASNPSCKAFTTTGTYGGYLKNAAATSYREGAVAYIKA